MKLLFVGWVVAQRETVASVFGGDVEDLFVEGAEGGDCGGQDSDCEFG